MKKIIAVLMVLASIFIFASCSFTSDSVEQAVGIEEAVIKRYSAKEIKNAYEIMLQHFDKQPSYNSPKFFSPSETNVNAYMEYLPLFSSVRQEFIEKFGILKEFLEANFDKYCNEYEKIDENTYARIRLNDTLSELELAIKEGNSYTFYSNYYLDDLCHKYMDYKEGRRLFVEVNYFEYAVAENNKITYPVTLLTEEYGGSNYTVNNDEELEEMDVIEAYDTLKYPFRKHFSADMVKSLLNSSHATFDGEKQFRKEIDKTIYNYNVIGDFDIEGMNFHGDILTGSIDGNIIKLNAKEYNVYTRTPGIFYMSKGNLYWRLLVDTYSNFYLVGKNVHKTENGVKFKLVDTIDLNKPVATAKFVFIDNFGYEEPIKDKNVLDTGTADVNKFIAENDGKEIELGLNFCYQFDNGNFMSIVDLPNLPD